MKEKRKKSLFAALIAFCVVCSLAAACLPGGAANTWQRVFSFFGLSDFSAAADSAPLSVHVLDVGKADSILIECNSKYLLVDGATADRGDSVVAYLKRHGVKSLEAVVNTHPDEDHIGGLANVLQAFPAARYLCPDVPKQLIPSTEEYRRVQEILSRKKIQTEHPAAGEAFRVGGMLVQVLGPVAPGEDTNNNSIVLKLTYGTVRFLLMGDAGEAEEQTLLSSGRDLSAEILKVGHHGSATSTSQKFLDAVRPKYAAVSVGYDTSKLPKLSVLGRLKDAGVAVFRTDVSGTLIFMTDGKNITVKTEK